MALSKPQPWSLMDIVASLRHPSPMPGPLLVTPLWPLPSLALGGTSVRFSVTTIISGVTPSKSLVLLSSKRTHHPSVGKRSVMMSFSGLNNALPLQHLLMTLHVSTDESLCLGGFSLPLLNFELVSFVHHGSADTTSMGLKSRHSFLL